MSIKEQDIRTAGLIGEDAVEKLKRSRVLVLGVGGVGSFSAEAIARAGVGAITLVDFDEVSVSNINRQIFALHSTVGRPKVEVARERILDINPECRVEILNTCLSAESINHTLLSGYDYVVDAIDTTSVKIELAVYCEHHEIPLISSMGTGNKLDPTRFTVTDIYKTSVCPLARVMRSSLRSRGVKHLRVLFSDETPRTPDFSGDRVSKADGKRAPASISFVPSVAGLIIASEVIKGLVHEYI